MAMIIDFHSHILPACDHGSSGLSTSQKQIELSKNAGVDILLMPENFWDAYHGVIEAVKTGEVRQERIDESLTRIFKVKMDMMK